MNGFVLSLRQRKILYSIQNQTSFITGKDLAYEQKVSSRTIRNDIKEINLALAPYNASIISVNSKGYKLQAENPQEILELNRIENALFSKEDRIRYLVFRLCLSDEPINLYDLEDEIFVSHTTLLNDLHSIRQTFTTWEPYIILSIFNNTVCFEKNEAKIRNVLLNLFHKNWDYHSKGNAFYGFHFLDEEFVSFVAFHLETIIHENHIYMEDPALVNMVLSLAIMNYRIQSGHTLPPNDPVPRLDKTADKICQTLFSIIENHLQSHFPSEEKDAIYLFLSAKCMKPSHAFTREEAAFYFSPVILETATAFLNKINEFFQIDFSSDDDFYKSLITYLCDLQSGQSTFTHQQNVEDVKSNLLCECEFAYLFQEQAPQFIHRNMTEIELINLAILFAGAFWYYQTLHPEKKLKALLYCHEKLSTGWALKRKLQIKFQDSVNITELLPVHNKNAYDFADTDIIFTTVNKKFNPFPAERILLVDSSPAMNFQSLEYPISLIKLKSIIPIPNYYSPKKLFAEAYWHENESYTQRFPIIETLASDFIQEGIASEKHLHDILKREATFSFITKPGIVFLYSTLPAAETRLSFMTLASRIIWGPYKIRTIVMAVFKKEDINMLFHLEILLYNTNFNLEIIKNLKTKEELMQYYLSI